MEKLNLGIIGVGHLGSIHARLAAQSESINLVGVFDLNRSQADHVGSNCGTRVFKEMDELLGQCQAVCIVVPTNEHYSVALQALDSDCHIFLEKPIAATVDEARSIVHMARQKGKKVQVGHIERFNPALLAIEGHPLQPMFIEAHRLTPFNPRGCDVSVVLDLMIHDLDLVLHLVQSRVTHLDACGVSVVTENEDIANVRLQFATGCVANLTCSRIAFKPMRRMRLFQKNQYLALDFLEKKAEIFKLHTPGVEQDPGDQLISQIGTSEHSKNIVCQKPSSPEVNSLQLELEEFARAIAEDRDPAVTGEQGIAALETAMNILEQMVRPN